MDDRPITARFAFSVLWREETGGVWLGVGDEMPYEAALRTYGERVSRLGAQNVVLAMPIPMTQKVLAEPIGWADALLNPTKSAS